MNVFRAAVSLLLFGVVVAHPHGGGKGGKGGKGKKSDEKENRCKDKNYNCPRIRKDPSHAFGDYVAIANRGGGTISLVHPRTLETAIEYALPDGGEPMYFAIAQSKSELWVGDRANNRLVILRMKGCDLEFDGYIPTPAGLFHTMITQREEDYPIAVTTCDIDNVIVVHDLTTRRLLATLGMPQEAVDSGAKPHDVTTNGDYIFVTFLGTDDGAGYVASFDAYDFSLIAVLETEADPHVAVRDNTNLFIAAQGEIAPGFVIQASIPELEVITTIARPAPHGMYISHDSKYLYTTNIALGGSLAVDTWDASTGILIDCPPVEASFPIPHNPAVSFDGSMIFITHSGATSKINSAFRTRNDGCIDPDSEMIFETNLNPFGLAIIPPAEPLVQCLNE